jgi:hypothetical protein
MSHIARKLFQHYKTGLILALPCTTCLGFSSGLVENFSTKPYERKSTSLDVFTTMIGFSTLGIATGLAYPITFPAIMYEVITHDGLLTREK